MQTFKWSMVETALNIGSGFFVSLLMWEYVVSVAIERGYLTMDDSFAITSIFTVSSVIRSLIWRRLFNKFHQKKEA